MTTASASGTTESPRTFDASLEVESLYERVRKLEGGPAEPKRRSPALDWLSPILSSVVLGLFAFFLTGRAERAARERELNTTNAAQMQTLILQLIRGGGDTATAAALVLTTFGRYAIPPLVANLNGSPQSATAAANGLANLAITNHDDVCTTLAGVLDNRSGRFTAQAHTEVIRILGSVECKDAVEALQRYRTFLARAATDSNLYKQAVLGGLPSNIAESERELARNLQLLGAR